MVAFDSLILYHYLHLVNFPFSYWISTCLKKILQWNCHFYKELSFLRNNINCLTNVSADQTNLQFPIPSRIKFMIGTLVKFPISEMSRMTIKGNIWYIHDFLKAVGNNIRVLFLIFDWLYWSSKAAVIACFWYFNNNDIFSVITPLNFDNDNVSLIQIFRLHTEFCLPYLFFSASKSKVNSYIKFFIENQLPVKTIQFMCP